MNEFPRCLNLSRFEGLLTLRREQIKKLVFTKPREFFKNHQSLMFSFKGWNISVTQILFMFDFMTLADKNYVLG